MIVDKKIEKLENSAVKLSVTVGKENTEKEYKDLLTKYSKEAVIKGFRKGKVPVSVMEKKFGEGIKAEAMGNVIDNSLKEAFEKIDEKPLGYSYPELQGKPEMVPGEDFTYEITYDIFPEIELGEYKGLEVKEIQTKIGKSEEEEELKKLQMENSFVVDKKDKTVAKDSIITVDYCELNDKDEALEATKREAFTFTVGSEMNYYKIDEEVTGMKLDEEKVIEKSYADDFTDKDLAGTTRKIKVKITAVKERELPKIDDDLAQDIDEKFETLDDLKKDIKSRLTKSLDNIIRQKNIDQIIDKVVETSNIDVPASMTAVEIENDWRNMLQQMGATEEQILPFLSKDGKSKENIQEEWKPGVIKKIKSQLIIGKIMEHEKIEVSDEEIETDMIKKAEEAGMKVEDYKKNFGEERLKQYLKEELSMNKLFDFLLESAKISKGDKVKYAELVKA